jgi:hypothetical protein
MTHTTTPHGHANALDRVLPDPPLLRQETEACHTQLSLLLHLATDSGMAAAARACDAQRQLEQLTLAVLERFAGGSQQQQQQQQQKPQGASGSAELVAFAPVVVSTLKALAGCGDAEFRRQLPSAFPALSALSACDHTTPDVQRALSDLLLARVAPLLGAEGGSSGAGGRAPVRSSSGAGGGGRGPDGDEGPASVRLAELAFV